MVQIYTGIWEISVVWLQPLFMNNNEDSARLSVKGEGAWIQSHGLFCLAYFAYVYA